MKVLHGFYNTDENRVELTYSDGSVLMLNCEKVENFYHVTRWQLAREKKKFLYKVVKEGARARAYEDALQWLVDARLVHKVYRSTAPGLAPLRRMTICLPSRFTL